jgi:hypothetical protein
MSQVVPQTHNDNSFLILSKAIYVIIFLPRDIEVPPVEGSYGEEDNSIGFIPSVM